MQALGRDLCTLLIAGATAFSVLVGTAQATIIHLNPRATYLQESSDPLAVNASAIGLSGLGISPGDLIRIEVIGSFNHNLAGDQRDQTVAVFSASATLLSDTVLNRVQDAIDTGTDYITNGDIPEDFLAGDTIATAVPGVTIGVPAGATHIFIAARDNHYSDNSDPNGNYGVSISVVPEPGSLVLSALCGMLAITRRR